jgi:hypothetical protein
VGAECWCWAFSSNPAQASEEILKHGNGAALRRGINEAIDRRDSESAKRLRTRLLKDIPRDERDDLWLADVEHHLSELSKPDETESRKCKKPTRQYLGDPNIWRGFHDEFRGLAHEELAAARAGRRGHVLVANVSYEGPNDELGQWQVYGTRNERLRSAFDSISARAGLALQPPHGIDPRHYWLRHLFFNLLENRSKYVFQTAGNERGTIQPVCAASAMFCNRLVAESVALIAVQARVVARRPRASDTTGVGLENYVLIGRRRAKLVAKLIKELNALRPHMQIAEEDYSQLRKKYPKYEVFKICEKNPLASEFVKMLANRTRVNKLAYQLAAAHFGVSAATIETAWKRYKPKVKPERKPA